MTEGAKANLPRNQEDILYQVGTGNWEAFNASPFSLGDVQAAAGEWAAQLLGVERPWLCWNVDHAWCVAQQRLVKAVGWTPVVGFDPRVGPPPVEPGGVLIDFNARFRLPTMWLHFPLEFTHLYCSRLAFWHADCLIRLDKMRALSDLFRSLPDGEMAAVQPKEGWRTRIRPQMRRYWEVVGLTTAAASRNQFENGCGWWISFANHMSSNPEVRAERSKYYWDSGVGIRYWHKSCGGRVHLIPEEYIEEGHFTLIGRKNYKRASPTDHRRNLSLELSLNNDLKNACDKLELGFLCSPVSL